jgi:outer membrane protein
VLRRSGVDEGRVNSLLKAVIVVLLVAPAFHGAAQPLTLRDAVDAALSRNPAVVSSAARERSAAARDTEARAARFPRIELTESATRGNNPVFVFGSLLEQGAFAARHFDPAFLNAPDALTNYRAALTARFAIFDRLHTSTAIRQSGNGVERASAESEETRQRLRAETVARFYGVHVAEAKLGVARDVVKNAEADAKFTRDRFEQGLLVESDALSADVQLAALRQRVIAAEGELAIARVSLAILLQRPASDVAIGGALPAPRVLELNLDDALARAVSQRAPIVIASSMTADSRLRLVAQRGTMLPRVDAFGTFGASGGTFGRRSTDHTAGIVVTLDLFDRARPARVAAARAEIDVANASEAMARDAVTMEVIAAWHRLRAARDTAAVAATAVDQAQSASRIVRDRYEHGLIPMTEHLHAQTALVTARFDLLGANYENIVAHAELLRAIGDLNDVQPFL